MARFMFKVSYSQEGMQGLMKEGAANRRAAIQKLASEMGGSVSTFDFAFGDTDVYLTAEFPDQISAAAITTAVGAAGTGSVETVVLLSPEDIDAAIAMHAPYRAPGA